MEQNNEQNTTKLYELKTGFARHNNLLIYFAAKTLVETEKALYLYGHGTTESTKTGRCCRCGRTLTHPVSVELGIGPECGQHYHDWNLIGGYTKENIERLKGALIEIIIDRWIPKSQIVSVTSSTEVVNIPKDHPKLAKVSSNELTGSRATLAINAYQERVAKLQFKYDLALLNKVRELPGRRYHKEEQCWTVPIYPATLNSLKELGFTLSADLEAILQRLHTNKVMKINIPGLKGELYPFQRAGVAFIEDRKGRALIADEMGLGKTIQALAWLQMHPENRPAAIVVPASLKLNWKREIEHWMSNTTVTVVSGTQSYPITADIVIINYDILPAWLERLRNFNINTLITDECHYYKSNKAQRTKAVKMLAKGIPHIIALSGTPIVNRPVEAYNAIQLVEPTLFPKAMYYVKRYCGAHYNGFGWDFTGATKTEELHTILTGSIMLRRLKKDVLADLPEKVYTFIPIELTNTEEYTLAESHFIQYIRETRGANAARRVSSAEDLVQTEVLKQVAIRGKLTQAIAWIQDFIDVDGKLVVFAVHRFVIDELMATFKNVAVKLDGSCSAIQRQEAVDKFQNDPKCRLFIGNIQAAGTGITLTAASNVAFLELPWTPGALVQAEDRCHRIGQKDSVNIHYLLAANTIDERIAEKIDAKHKVLAAILDGKKVDEDSLLTELINSYIDELQ